MYFLLLKTFILNIIYLKIIQFLNNTIQINNCFFLFKTTKLIKPLVVSQSFSSLNLFLLTFVSEKINK